MLNSPFPEYVYSNESTIKTNGEIEVDMTFTKQEIEDTLTYLEKFDPMYLSINLKNKLEEFGDVAESDLFYCLPQGIEAIEFVDRKIVLPRIVINDYAFQVVIRLNDIESLHYCIRKCGTEVDWKSICDEAIVQDSHDIIEWIKVMGPPFAFRHSLRTAALNDNYDLFKWIYKFVDTGKHIDTVLANNLEMIKWLYYNEYTEWSKNTMDCAAYFGNLKVIKWLHDHVPDCCTFSAMDNAAENGHLDVLIWLDENRTEGCTKKAMDSAIQGKQMKILEWLYENRTEGCSFLGLKGAILRRDPKLIGWLIDKKYFTVKEAAEAAQALIVPSTKKELYVENE